MYELKQIGKVFTSKSVGNGQSSYVKKFTGPRSHKGWETLLYIKIMYLEWQARTFVSKATSHRVLLHFLRITNELQIRTRQHLMNIQNLYCSGTMEINTIMKGIDMPIPSRRRAQKLFLQVSDIYMELNPVIWNSI